MNKLINRLFFSRFLAAVLISNFLSLVILNLFQMCPGDLIYVYPLSFFAAWWILLRLRIPNRKITLDRLSVLLVVVMLILLTIPRLTYVLEWIPGNVSLVTNDDKARLAELISMTLSPRYPLQHPANQIYLFSFYYTSLYPMSLVKFVFPFLTLKDSIFLGNLFYHTLILMSLLEISHFLLPKKHSIRMFVFLCTLFGGLDWLINKPTELTGHFEWWQHKFHGNTQISSFYTGMFWTIHHFVAFYALIIMHVFLFYTRKTQKLIKPAVVLLLSASALYSSPFSVMSVPLFALIHLRVVWNKLCRSWVLPPVIAAMIVPLYIFVGKLPSQSFRTSTFRIFFTGKFWLDKLLSAPIFFTLVPLIEFAGIPILLLFMLKKMSGTEKRYFLAAITFFALTYVIAYSGSNNFSMRGMFLPSAVLFFLFAKYSAPFLGQPTRWKTMVYGKILVVFLIAIVVIGTLKECGGRSLRSLSHSMLKYRLLHQEPPPWILPEYRKLSRNRNCRTYKPGAADRLTPTKYNAEKFIDRLEISEMSAWEKEFLRMPRRGLFR